MCLIFSIVFIYFFYKQKKEKTIMKVTLVLILLQFVFVLLTHSLCAASLINRLLTTALCFLKAFSVFIGIV